MNMSFFLTQEQLISGEKDVTRRLNKYGPTWKRLKAGDVLWAVKKSQGLKKGEKVERICRIEVLSVRQEKVGELMRHPYGKNECVREGFPDMTQYEFAAYLLTANGLPDSALGAMCTRIEFKKI